MNLTCDQDRYMHIPLSWTGSCVRISWLSHVVPVTSIFWDDETVQSILHHCWTARADGRYSSAYWRTNNGAHRDMTSRAKAFSRLCFMELVGSTAKLEVRQYDTLRRQSYVSREIGSIFPDENLRLITQPELAKIKSLSLTIRLVPAAP